MKSHLPFLDQFNKGFALGELTMISAGRQTGKSNYIMTVLKARASMQKFTLLSSSVTTDTGVTWHTVEVPVFDVLEWLEEQDPTQYSEVVDTGRYIFRRFCIHEQLFTMMALRWS